MKKTYDPKTNTMAYEQLAPAAGDLGAGVLEAGELAFPTLVVSTPELRAKTSQWLGTQFDDAKHQLHNAWYCATMDGSREIDQVILAEAYDTCRMLLWMAQCTGLQELAERIERQIADEVHDKATLRHAQDVAEARRARST